ncbi:MAG: NAD-dependent epimerase/dehydratase family protein [Terrimicrobiaceae bacterium]
MKIFVTGATGFIGSHFVRAAVKQKYEITALRYPGTSPVISVADNLEERAQITWIDGALSDVASERMAGIDALVHLAAAGVNPKQASWDLCFDVNVSQSIQIWRRAVSAGIRRFVICGSCFEYGLSGERFEFIPTSAPLEPSGAYHASKAAATMSAIALCVENQLALSILRPFHVFGEGEGPDRLWPSLRKAALAGEDFPMSPGEQIRDFIPVEEVAQAFLRALATRHPIPGKPLLANIGAGKPRTLLEFSQYWWNHWNAKGKLLPGALPYRPNEVMRYVPEVSPL